ncbi:XRE family transcriptional regulator [Providencia stuartii]|uniref:XRE family transcriptional regulator n=1 Tax=Providencia stuartii TaxID=588 RepID=UPI00114058FB|nr:helix-turn-helix transcriptional regulator [Providencia stuartii]MDN0012345.1 helix-turn-helix transcriptional regulator [Providencia stuartii]MDT2015232.1 helix-turn-helix transcriptional regulator [Providencia stuartii]MDT2083146.1 helix-turn-helix transcriptional regulator [Providencia stuartii]TPW66415.1 helix-turn-helix transcriptional regulator [Providencia stuartii]
MKTFAERLKMALEASSMSQEQLAKAVGISQPAVAKLVSGRAKSSTKSLEMAIALGVNPTWLVNGVGHIRDGVPESNVPSKDQWGKVIPWSEKDELESDEVEVPFLKDIEFACGDGSYNEDDYNGFKLRFSKSTLRKVGANTDGTGVLCFPATGDSMEPVIPDGATVSVNCNDKRIVDGKVYAINQNGWKRIKLLVRSSPEKIIIRSYNKDVYPDEEVSADSIEIIGKVFWVASLL